MTLNAEQAADIDIDVLSKESIETVLAEIAKLDTLEIGTETVSQRMRSSIATAYRSLLLCELDGDRMLRRRLDLVRTFAYPSSSAAVPAATFGSKFGVATARPKPQTIWTKFSKVEDPIPEIPSFARALFGALSTILLDDLRGVGEIEFAMYKYRLDAWISETVAQSLRQNDLSTDGLVVFQRLAEAIRKSDPMTDPESASAEELRKTIAAQREAAAQRQSEMDDRRRDLEADQQSPDELLRSIERIRAQTIEARNEVMHARDVALEASGQTGEVILGRDFLRAGWHDERKATLLSVGSVFALLVAFGVGFFLIGDLSEVGVATEIAKLALTLPIFAVSAYLGRLSGHYRESARWAKSASTQLMSLNAFAQGLSDEAHRDELRLVLGTRVFGDPGFGVVAKNPDIDDVTAIIESMGNALRRE